MTTHLTPTAQLANAYHVTDQVLTAPLSIANTTQFLGVANRAAVAANFGHTDQGKILTRMYHQSQDGTLELVEARDFLSSLSGSDFAKKALAHDADRLALAKDLAIKKVYPDIDPTRFGEPQDWETPHMGSTFIHKTTDELTGKPVALKIVRQNLLLGGDSKHTESTGAFVPLYLQENGVPNIFPVLGVYGLDHDFVHEDSRAIVLATEFVPGETLFERISRRGKLPFAEAMQLAKGYLATLQSAYRLGVSHGDIKSKNLYIGTKDDQLTPYVADWQQASLFPDRGVTQLDMAMVMGGFFAAFAGSVNIGFSDVQKYLREALHGKIDDDVAKDFERLMMGSVTYISTKSENRFLNVEYKRDYAVAKMAVTIAAQLKSENNFSPECLLSNLATAIRESIDLSKERISSQDLAIFIVKKFFGSNPNHWQDKINWAVQEIAECDAIHFDYTIHPKTFADEIMTFLEAQGEKIGRAIDQARPIKLP